MPHCPCGKRLIERVMWVKCDSFTVRGRVNIWSFVLCVRDWAENMHWKAENLSFFQIKMFIFQDCSLLAWIIMRICSQMCSNEEMCPKLNRFSQKRFFSIQSGWKHRVYSSYRYYKSKHRVRSRNRNFQAEAWRFQPKTAFLAYFRHFFTENSVFYASNRDIDGHTNKFSKTEKIWRIFFYTSHMNTKNLNKSKITSEPMLTFTNLNSIWQIIIVWHLHMHMSTKPKTRVFCCIFHWV